MWSSGLLVLLAIVPAVATAAWHPRGPLWSEETLLPDEVSVAQAQAWGSRVLWIDARNQLEYQTHRIPGAWHLSMDTWDAQIQGVVEAWRPGVPTVVYCNQRTCAESRHVAEALREEMGWSQVFVLHGGWSAWKTAEIVP
jgi:rhodanese-related sulfurtransferase